MMSDFFAAFGAVCTVIVIGFMALCTYAILEFVTDFECSMRNVQDESCTEYSLKKPPEHERRLKP